MPYTILITDKDSRLAHQNISSQTSRVECYHLRGIRHVNNPTFKTRRKSSRGIEVSVTSVRINEEHVSITIGKNSFFVKRKLNYKYP